MSKIYVPLLTTFCLLNICVYYQIPGADEDTLGPGQIEFIKEMEIEIDKNVDPCYDFYKFACGGYDNKVRMVEARSGIYSMDYAKEINRDRLLTSFENNNPNNNDSESMKKVEFLYRTCVDELENDKENSTSFKNFLQQFGGWPVLQEDQSVDNFNWIQMIEIDGNKHWYSAFLSFQVRFKISSPKEVTPHWEIDIDSPLNDLKVTSKFLGNNENNVNNKIYLDYMTNMAIHFGANEEHAREELEEVVKFEVDLINILKPNNEITAAFVPEIAHEEESQSMDLYKLTSKYPFFPWNKFIQNWLPVNVSLKDVNDKLYVLNPYYLNNIEKLIQSTSKRTLANYIVWKKVDAYASFFDKTTRGYHDGFYHIKRRVAAEECLKTIAKKLPLLTSAVYARDHFDEKMAKNVNEIVKVIQNELLRVLNNSDWMDDEDKKEVVEKVEAMSIVVGYPKELLDASKLAEFYNDLEFSSGSYAENILRNDIFLEKKSWTKLDATIRERDYWTNFGNLVRTAQAAYDQSKNTLYIYAGLIQDNFYDENYPAYMNYGRIGSFIAHEMAHSLDSSGFFINKDGKTFEGKNKTQENFKNKQDCLREQYGKYRTLGDMYSAEFTAIITLAENMADNIGMKMSYFAYKNFSKNEDGETLEDKFYTPEQMFWLNTANMWCSNSTFQLMNRITGERHSKPENRIRGPLSNIKEFADDFKCPIDSPMNPSKKCILW